MRYYFSLINKCNEDLGVFIPDGSHKSTALNRAKKWMRENGINIAWLEVNSMRTDNIVDIIEIEL